MSRLGRVTPSAGRDVIDRKTCYLSLLAQAAVWLLELRVSQHFSTFLSILRLICSVHGYPARRAASTADPDNSLIPQRWVGAPDFSSEWAGTGLTSLKRKRRLFENTYRSMRFKLVARKYISFNALRLRFRLVARDFPGIVCILEGD